MPPTTAATKSKSGSTDIWKARAIRITTVHVGTDGVGRAHSPVQPSAARRASHHADSSVRLPLESWHFPTQRVSKTSSPRCACFFSRYNIPVSEVSTPVAPAPEATPAPRRFTLRQRIILRLIIAAGYGFIRLVGPTLRVCVSREEGAQETIGQRPLIGSFW